MDNLIRKFRNIFISLPKTKIITFVLITMFFASLVPISTFGATATKTTLGKPSSYRTWLDGGLTDLAGGMTAMIIGEPTEEEDATDTTEDSGMYKGGAIQEVAKVSDSFYENQPASFMVWAQDQYYKAQDTLSLEVSAADAVTNPNQTTTYMPGTGYNILKPVMGMWQLSANIVYALLIIVLVLVAFLIMLRKPLGGKEIVTIANSIPSILATLILVVFSYPLCSVFIDLVYLGSNVSYNVLIGNQNAPGYNLQETIPEVDETGKKTGNKIEIKKALQPDDPQMSVWMITNLTGFPQCKTPFGGDDNCSFDYIMPAGAQQSVIGKGLDQIIKVVSATGIQNSLVSLIFAIATLQVAFKIFFKLLNSYLVLSLFPIIAPFSFLSGAMPGGTTKALGNFIRTLGGAALSFIVTYICFLMLVLFSKAVVNTNEANTFSDQYSKIGQIGWTPPLLGYSPSQIQPQGDTEDGLPNLINSLLLIGFYLAIPNILDAVKKWVEVSGPIALIGSTTKDFTQASQTSVRLGQTLLDRSPLGRQFQGGK